MASLLCVISQGDSGGPLACQSSENSRWYLHGVTSSGGSFSCDRLGIYSNVSDHVAWIREMIDLYGVYT